MSNNTNQLSIQPKTDLPSEEMIGFDIAKIKELNNKSVELIFDEKIDNGLEILKRLEGILETNAIENKTAFDKKILIIILHNLACCYQKLKDYKNCISYLEAVIFHFDGTLEKKHNIIINCDYFMKSIQEDQLSNSLLGEIILELRFSAKFHLQMCAVLSQAGEHIQALAHAKLSSLMCEDNLVKTYFLYKQMEKEKNINDEEYPKYEEQIKQSEGIILSLYQRVIHLRQNKQKDTLTYNNSMVFRKKEIGDYTTNEKIKESIRKIYGVIQPDDWILLLNIGNIMYLSALTYDDLDLDSDPKYELLRDAILEKTVMLTVSYFCIATEMRLMKSQNSNSTIAAVCSNTVNNNTNFNQFNGNFWHKKAVEYSSMFLPVSCPIIKHYITSYNKHYGSSLECIPDNQTFNMRIDLLRSEIEVDKDPMVFASCSKVAVNLIPPEVELNNKNEIDVAENKFIASMTKLKEDKAPKFKLNFFHIKKDSCDNINQFDKADKIMKEKSKSDRIKINKVLAKNSPEYNNTNINAKKNKMKINNNPTDKGGMSRDKKIEASSKTHREFVVYKKDLLTKMVSQPKGRPITSRHNNNNNNKTNNTKTEAKKTVKLKNGSNNVNLPVHSIYPSNQIKANKDCGILLIDKLLSNKTKIQGQNISYSSTSLSLNSLLKSFKKQKKIANNYNFPK